MRKAPIVNILWSLGVAALLYASIKFGLDQNWASILRSIPAAFSQFGTILSAVLGVILCAFAFYWKRGVRRPRKLAASRTEPCTI
jgi:hypothetical protein